MNAQEIREEFRNYLFENGVKPVFTKRQYKTLIKTHLITLKKHLNQFKIFFRIYFKKRNIKKYEKRLGMKLTPFLRRPPRVTEVYKIIRGIPELKQDFFKYLEIKTFFSYEIGKKPIPLKIPNQKRYKSKAMFRDYLHHRPKDEGSRTKFGQFCYLILAEYIILHNYMWVSGLKTEEIQSIDGWMVNIK